MLTDDRLIDQIRSELREELSNLHPSPTLVTQVWPQARADRRRPSSGISRWCAGGRAVAMGVSIVATIAVATLAIVVLGHGRHNVASRRQTDPGVAAIAPTQGRAIRSAAALRMEMRALRGHPIVILAWGTWCPPCTKQLPAFASVAAGYRHRVAFLGVDIDDPPAIAKSYLARHALRFRNYRATLKQLQSILRVPVVGLPTTFFISATGKVIAHILYPRSSQALRREVETLLLEQSLTGGGPGPSQVPGVSPLLTKNFGVFRRPVNVRRVLPSGIASGFTHSFYKQAILARTRYVALGHGVQIWLVPGSQSICMVVVGTGPPKHVWRSTGCIRIESAATSPFPWIAHAGPGNTMAFIGLVPDGATVTATTRTGATVNVPVVDNIGYVANSSGFSGVKIRYRNGQISGFTISGR